MSVGGVNLILSQSIVTACSAQPKRVPTAEEVRDEMNNEWKMENRGGLAKFLFGKRAFPAVETGGMYICPNSYKGKFIINDFKTYEYSEEAKTILQDAILVMIEQDIKAEKDPVKIQELKDDKKNLMEHPGVFGDTTSEYLKMIHTEAGLYKIPSVTRDMAGQLENEIKEAIETKEGAPKFNYLTVRILGKTLKAIRDGRSWRGAVEGMFDTRAKIEEFQKSERINGPLTIKLKITEEKEKQFELDNSDILKSLTGKMVPLTPLPKK